MYQIRVGSKVIVNECLAGVVAYICPNGDYGVNLIGEGKRVDEWMPGQVRAAEYGEYECYLPWVRL